MFLKEVGYRSSKMRVKNIHRKQNLVLVAMHHP